MGTNTSTEQKGLPVLGAESIMSRKEHGTSKTPVQDHLRWSCNQGTADRICNFNVSTHKLILFVQCCACLYT